MQVRNIQLNFDHFTSSTDGAVLSQRKSPTSTQESTFACQRADVVNMLVLFETPAGHALFKVLNDKALRDVGSDFESPTAIKELVQLKAFQKFRDTTAALAAATAMVEGKPSKDLRKWLKKEVNDTEEIAVGDSKLGAAIKEKTGLQCVYSGEVNNVMRGIRANLELLMKDSDESVAAENARKAMVLGLAHSLSRYKLKFSPDKVDTMIVQAIGLLDDLDKEVNTYAMRLREWYGWHFPELGKIVLENLPYGKIVKKMGMRTEAAETDFSDILSEELEEEVKAAAQISMGTEISEEDIMNIRQLCDQVITLTEYRTTLSEYLRNRMIAIAPNLTAMVGELVGARLIAHAGSLLSLAKYPASTVQILGAEKALFRALKTKHATPKYGLIFHASLVGQANPKHKGRISRTLSSKCALAVRVDALGDTDEGATVGENGRLAVEARLRRLEGNTEMLQVSKQSYQNRNQEKYTPSKTPTKPYNTDNDVAMTDVPAVKVEAPTVVNGKEEPKLEEKENGVDMEKKTPDSKISKKKKRSRESTGEGDATEKSGKKKKSKKDGSGKKSKSKRKSVEAAAE